MKIGKFIAEWKFPLGKKECPYCYRWRLDFYWFSFRIHYWIGSDDSRAFHDHPINFITFVLWGHYIDVRPHPDWDGLADFVGTFNIRFRRRGYRHMVLCVKKPTITLLFTWGKPKRYSFYLPDGKRMTRDKYFHEMGHHPCN
jgi:hypothetical protein